MSKGRTADESVEAGRRAEEMAVSQQILRNKNRFPRRSLASLESGEVKKRRNVPARSRIEANRADAMY